MFRFKKEKIHSFSHTLPDGRVMEFDAFWASFRPEVDCAFWIRLLPRYIDADVIRVLGPFWRDYHRPQLAAERDRRGKWDIYLTAENRDNPTDLARKCIGFRVPKTAAELRFPYWKWYLTWPGFETDPPYERFGARLSIDALMRPLAASHEAPTADAYAAMSKKAVLLTSHFKRHRRQLWRHTDATLGCDAFGRKIRPTDLPKSRLLAPYPYNLCPENRAAEGYITEKIPEAFLCGCVPVTYCAPEDLARDFNPDAVINLYGLSRRAARARLAALASDYDRYLDLRAAPLLRERPQLQPLLTFLAS